MWAQGIQGFADLPDFRRAHEAGLVRSLSDLLWTSIPLPLSETSVTTLSIPLSSLASSPTFLSTLLPILTPRLLPPTSFPTATHELLHRRAHAEAWRELISELPERELTRLLRRALTTLDQDLLRQRRDRASSLPQRIRAATFLLSELFGPLSPNEEPWKIAVSVILEEGEAWDAEQGGMARVLLGWVGADVTARVALMQAVMDVWGRVEGIKGAGAGTRSCECSAELLVPSPALIQNLAQSSPSLYSSPSTLFRHYILPPSHYLARPLSSAPCPPISPSSSPPLAFSGCSSQNSSRPPLCLRKGS